MNQPRLGRNCLKPMADVELILRFFAYRQIDSFHSGLNRITALLDRFLIEGNKFRPEILSDYREMFESTISFLFLTFGNRAFCRKNREGREMGPTKIVYDPLMYISSLYSCGPDREALLSKKEVLINELTAMYQEYDELFSGRRTNLADTHERNVLVAKVFQIVLKEILR